jgi:hypothetical protein
MSDDKERVLFQFSLNILNTRQGALKVLWINLDNSYSERVSVTLRSILGHDIVLAFAYKQANGRPVTLTTQHMVGI